jgi:anti-sigma28 factor (negative regulator of flagellin synthesis)
MIYLIYKVRKMKTNIRTIKYKIDHNKLVNCMIDDSEDLKKIK